MSELPALTSVDHIFTPLDTIPPSAQPAQDAGVIFAGIRALIKACGPNRHSQAIVAIMACIDHGMNTRRRIIGALRQLGFNTGHVGKLLREETGSDPSGIEMRRAFIACLADKILRASE